MSLWAKPKAKAALGVAVPASLDEIDEAWPESVKMAMRSAYKLAGTSSVTVRNPRGPIADVYRCKMIGALDTQVCSSFCFLVS